MSDEHLVVDPLTEVRVLLAGSGIDPPEHDLSSLARILPAARRRMERMYAVETGDEVTAAVFRASIDGAL